MEKGLQEQQKDSSLFISKEDINHVIKIIKPLTDSGVLIVVVTEIVENEIKK